MNRYVCIHGHFYQPPRENPWLEEIELQDPAYPYRNWNERISVECYAPNAASRILDSQSYIANIVNNYAKISFNFGPTLLVWLERFEPEIYKAILEADRLSQKNFSGHGAALAQVYNHMIMPLANERDKRTQVVWGIRDFESRFKRKPEGMWLPETAVDRTTLEILADCGIQFTILAPRQAKRVRRIGESNWHEVNEASLDTQHPYVCLLPSKQKMVIFFYDGPIAQAIAFSGLLDNGEAMAHRLIQAFPRNMHESRLVQVATDGETYGHHHRFGNMALSYCLHFIEANDLARITIPAEFLEKNPPRYEVEIIENSSWSCVHGIERWRIDCGCHSGAHTGWNQKWREPLRSAFDGLRDQLTSFYEKAIASLSSDPWKLRDEYISVILDRHPEHVKSFLREHIKQDFSPQDIVKILQLLEMQRHLLFMYTSCGWFFDDIGGIEAVQVIQYAARVIQLANDALGLELETDFIKSLALAPSNSPDMKNGAQIYRQNVKPHIIDLLSVGAHYAIASLFEDYPSSTEIYSYRVESQQYHLYESGKQRFVIGKARISSTITWEEGFVDFVILHFGDYNLHCGVRHHLQEDFDKIHEHLKTIFLQNDIPQVMQQMNQHFGKRNYTLWDLFKNEQGKVLNQIFKFTLKSIETQFREIYEHYYPLMQIRPGFRIPLPKALAMTVEFILNRDMVDILESKEVDIEQMESVAREIKRWSFTRDKEAISFVASRKVNLLTQEFSQKAQEISLLNTLCEVLRILDILSLPLDLWKAQNIYFAMSRDLYLQVKNKPGREEWLKSFEVLGHYLKVRLPA